MILLNHMLPLLFPAFLAGVLTFLAPCTLPLVPAYLGFISGVTTADLRNHALGSRRKIFVNALGFVIGFGIVFILFGSAAGALGYSLREHRILLERIGGLFIILFGLLMLNVLPIPFLSAERALQLPSFFRRGTIINSLIVGASFGFSWTPCVGPILGSILTLAATAQGAGAGAFLLFIYALGLAVPFLLIALFLEYFSKHIASWSRALHAVSIAGGILLIVLGVLMITNMLGLWMASFYRLFGVPPDALLNYL